MNRSTKRRIHLEASGLCNRCGQRPPKAGLKTCQQCVDWRIERAKTRRAAGLCTTCLHRKAQSGIKSCQRCLDRRSEWHNNHLDYALKYRVKHGREYRTRIKAEVMQHYGSECKCCGENLMSMLTIDHINGGGNKHRQSLGHPQGQGAGPRFYSWLRINGYPNGYQVLCFNCNFSKHVNGGTCEHRHITTLTTKVANAS